MESHPGSVESRHGERGTTSSLASSEDGIRSDVERSAGAQEADSRLAAVHEESLFGLPALDATVGENDEGPTVTNR